MAITAAVTAVVSTGASLYNQNKAAKQQKRAAEARRKQENLKAQRSRVQQLRQARIASGQLEVGAASAGATDSSGRDGALASLRSQLKGNLNFSIQMDLLSDQASTAMGKAAKYGLYASGFSAVSSLAMAGASMMYGGGDPKPTTTPTGFSGKGGRITGPGSNYNNANNPSIFGGIY